MAFNIEAVSFCFLLNKSDFVVPIWYLYIAILRYIFNEIEKRFAMTQQVVMTAELMTLRDDTTRCDDSRADDPSG
jgi:hypothetical protein